MESAPTARVSREVAAMLAMGLLVAACGGSSSEPPASVASVEVTPATASREVGETVQLTATVKDADGHVLSGQAVAWSTSGSSVASVSSSGLVTALALGTAVITASSGSRNGYSTITVIPEPIASISVSPTLDTLLQGETVQLTATLRDATNNIVTGRNVTWISTAPGIASVSSAGLVTGVFDGVSLITASADDRSASATIRVFGRCAPSLAPTIAVNQTLNGTLAMTDCRIVDCVLCGFHPSDSSYADFYGITVTTATTVQIDMTASYDTYLWLWELATGVLFFLAADDDADPDDPSDPHDPVDKNAQLFFTLVPGKKYFIGANAFNANVTGDYQLKVTATASGAPRVSRDVTRYDGRKARTASIVSASSTRLSGR